MLISTAGKVVTPKHRAANHLEEGFVVSHKKDHNFLRPLREVPAYLHHKCGDMFKIGSRFHMKGV